MDKIAAALIIVFSTIAIITHAWYQPVVNKLAEVKAQQDMYRKSVIVGYVHMDVHTKELYFVEVVE